MARMGGEEFAVLLPNSSEMVAQSFSERLRSTVESMTILLPGHDPISLTISLGYACSVSFPELGPLDLYELADKALYAAKDQGRNRTVGAKEISNSKDMHPIQDTPDTSS